MPVVCGCHHAARELEITRCGRLTNCRRRWPNLAALRRLGLSGCMRACWKKPAVYGRRCPPNSRALNHLTTRGIRSFQVPKSRLSSDPIAKLLHEMGFVHQHCLRGHWTSGASAYSMACSSVMAWPSAQAAANSASSSRVCAVASQ